MENLILIVVGGKYKVYRDMGNGKRRLMGTFKTSDDAIRFMNGWNPLGKAFTMSNDFVYSFDDNAEEEIFRGWEEINNMENDEEYVDYEEDADWDFYGEEEFA